MMVVVKVRGVCPSCSTRPHGRDRRILLRSRLSPVPVRQWVLSLPKRLWYFLHHDASLAHPVLRIFLAEVEAALRS